jgi:Transglutaminase-like superfamily
MHVVILERDNVHFAGRLRSIVSRVSEKRFPCGQGQRPIADSKLAMFGGLVSRCRFLHAFGCCPKRRSCFSSGSRYCETDRLSETAWQLFGHTFPGWTRVQAICDYVHNHITFGYENARSTKTAWETFNDGKGVCRDFAHLGIAFCRCQWILQPGLKPILGRLVHVPRAKQPAANRPGLIARGRDAAAVAIATTFGPNTLENLRVWTDEVEGFDEGFDAASVARTNHRRTCHAPPANFAPPSAAFAPWSGEFPELALKRIRPSNKRSSMWTISC